jgi:hypothetical protein
MSSVATNYRLNSRGELYERAVDELSEDDKYWRNSLPATPFGWTGHGGSGDGNAGVKPALEPGEQATLDAFRNPLYVATAKELGIQDLNAEHELGRVTRHLAAKGQSASSAAAPPQAAQAKSLAQSWIDQNPGIARSTPATRAGYDFSSRGGTGGSSFASSLNADDNSIYPNIWARGDEMGQDFRSIGRRYYANAMRDSFEIGLAGREAVDNLSPDVKLSNYIDPWTTQVGGKTYMDRAKGYISV